MSTPNILPDRPSLDQLKTQAKELLRAHQSRDEGVADRLRAALPELSSSGDEDILSLKFALLDAQRAIASEYGFATWMEMSQHVDEARRGTFADLFQYNHGTAYLISHEVDLYDLAIALQSVSEAEKNVFTFNMPEPMRTEFELHSAAAKASVDDVEAARRRILDVVKRLADEGQLAWPPWEDRKPHMPGKTNRASVELEAKLQKTTRPRMSECSYDEIDEVMADLGQLGRLMGILHLEPLAKDVGAPFLRTGLQMALDGTEPDRVSETLENMMRSLLHEQEVRYRKGIAGMRSVQKGDNPAYVRETLGLIR